MNRKQLTLSLTAAAVLAAFSPAQAQTVNANPNVGGVSASQSPTDVNSSANTSQGASTAQSSQTSQPGQSSGSSAGSGGTSINVNPNVSPVGATQQSTT
jgi:hypothetical protein